MNTRLVKYLESNVEQLAVEVTDRMEEEQPELFARYRVRSLGRGRDPLDWCKEDTAFHLRHLAAALESDDLNEFQEYRSWLIGLLSARGIPPSDVEANFDAMADTLNTRLGNEARPAIAMLRAPMM
jgi:hypothetical protein